MAEIKELNSQERAERIKLSKLAERVYFLKTPQGLDWFLKSSEFSQDEKDYILFNIHDLKEISKLKLIEFKNRVRIFKELESV